jgi:hypothetical protein
MPGKQAKVLSRDDIRDLLGFASLTRHPIRNRVIVLLSVKAGLRAGEVAYLTWDMVLKPTGEVGSVIELRDHAAKKGSGRLIPLHSDLRDALEAWFRVTDGTGPVIRSERGGRMTPLSIVNWFAGAYRAIGLDGCSLATGSPRRRPPDLSRPAAHGGHAAARIRVRPAHDRRLPRPEDRRNGGALRQAGRPDPEARRCGDDYRQRPAKQKMNCQRCTRTSTYDEPPTVDHRRYPLDIGSPNSSTGWIFGFAIWSAC